jgi:hypothetical protein
MINFYLTLLENFRWTSDSALSEVGTVQVEMRDLSRVSGDKKYEVKFN